MSDADLVRSVCPRERLTLFNFMREFKDDLEEEHVKHLLLNEYEYYFKRQNMDIYGRFFKDKVKKRFVVEF